MHFVGSNKPLLFQPLAIWWHKKTTLCGPGWTYRAVDSFAMPAQENPLRAGQGHYQFEQQLGAGCITHEPDEVSSVPCSGHQFACNCSINVIWHWTLHLTQKSRFQQRKYFWNRPQQCARFYFKNIKWLYLNNQRLLSSCLKQYIPLQSFNWVRYWHAYHRKGSQKRRLLKWSCALKLRAHGLHELSRSKSQSMIQMNLIVAADLENSGRLRSLSQNSIASATLILKVLAARLTFIFAYAQST